MDTPQPNEQETAPAPLPAPQPETHTNPTRGSNPARGSNYLSLVGLFIMLFGTLFLIDQNLHTGWLSGIALPIAGAFMVFEGLRKRQFSWMVPACLILGLGIGAFVALSPLFEISGARRVGSLLIAFGIGWLLLCLVSYLMLHKTAWWAFFTGTIVLSFGLSFWFSKDLWLTDFVLFVVTGTGIGFLVWGIAERLLGLIIPGCILLGIGPGVWLAWSGVLSEGANGLTQTGIMLVCFGLGWLLLTPLSRLITNIFVWWPLIPGGIFFVVGWGLYIGGNPGNALSFIGNTGSIGLIMFGLYLFLMRQGIRK